MSLVKLLARPVFPFLSTIITKATLHSSVLRGTVRNWNARRNSKSRHFIKRLGLLLAASPVVAVNYNKMASNPDEVIKQADDLLAQNKIQEAYDLLSAHKDAENAEIQWRFARICYRLGKYHTPDKTKAQALANTGLDHASKAIALNDKSYYAYRWKGVLLNWSMEFEGYKRKIEKSFEIRENFDKAAELNPSDASTRHLIGRWCFEVANVPWYMRKAAQYIFATPPSSTYDEALSFFQQAEEINPGFYSSNWLYIGKCYLNLGKKEEAKEWLRKAVDYRSDVMMGDDLEAADEAKKLLQGL